MLRNSFSTYVAVLIVDRRRFSRPSRRRRHRRPPPQAPAYCRVFLLVLGVKPDGRKRSPLLYENPMDCRVVRDARSRSAVPRLPPDRLACPRRLNSQCLL